MTANPSGENSSSNVGHSRLQDYYSDVDGQRIPRTSIEWPPLHGSSNDITSDPFSSHRQREILPSLMNISPPGRSSTLPPLQRPLGPNRPRKQSITKRGRDSQHKKKNSKGSTADWLRRFQNDDRLRPVNLDRKAASAEPSADYGKRWLDLIDAADQAASAAGDIDEDRTPVSLTPRIYRTEANLSADKHFAGATVTNLELSIFATAIEPTTATAGEQLSCVSFAAGPHPTFLHPGCN